MNLNYKNWNHTLLLDILDFVKILIKGNSDNLKIKTQLIGTIVLFIGLAGD